MLLDEYRPHAFIYARTVDDLSQPWVASPETPARQLLPSTIGSPISLLSSASSTIARSFTRTKQVLKFHFQETESSAETQTRSRSFLRSISRLLRPFSRVRNRIRARVEEIEIEQYDPAELEPVVAPLIPLSAWKNWSYYARPCVNGVEVDNTSPSPQLDVELDLQDMFDYLKSPGGTPHPERWIKGQKHPALPPRPQYWKRVDPNKPLPFPWEVQLNPLLTHSLVSTPEYTPIYWNLSHQTSLIFFLTDNGDLQFLLDTDLCQPATCPFVTHMYICAYAFAPNWDIQHQLQWPVMIHSRDGITCEDIFVGVFDSFQQHVRKGEFERWGGEMRHMAMSSHHRPPLSNADGDAFMKRVDILGSNVFFRGLAPSMNMEGWVLLLGPEPPMMAMSNGGS